MHTDDNQQAQVKLSVAEMDKIKECGSYLMPFSKIALLLDRTHDADLEAAFYTEGSLVHRWYTRGDVEFTMNMHRALAKVVFSSATSADGKSIAVDRTALSALEAVRKKNKALLEKEAKEYKERFQQ